MSLYSSSRYYISSVVTLLTRFERPGQILSIFLGFSKALPAEVNLRHGGLRFRVRQAMDVWVIKETCIDGDYFGEEGLQPGWNVVDIGAGLGDFTVLAAKACHPGQIHAYEPLHESFSLLQENLVLNQVSNVQSFQEAAIAGGQSVTPLDTDVEAVSTRFISDSGSGSLPSVELAQVLDRLPGGRCDFLKIDCEGCEFDLLLKTPVEILKRVQRLSLETHDGYTSHTSAELAKFLADNGFRVYQRPNPVHDFLGFIFAYQP